MPRYLLQMEPEQKYAIVVDTRRRGSTSTRTTTAARASWPTTTSATASSAPRSREGDKRTPVGVYHVLPTCPARSCPTSRQRRLPINYPNDGTRQQGRDGHGIWLHGTPSDTLRPPKASDGCVVLTNRDLDALPATCRSA